MNNALEFFSKMQFYGMTLISDFALFLMESPVAFILCCFVIFWTIFGVAKKVMM